jgi:HAMP domain-containing protein
MTSPPPVRLVSLGTKLAFATACVLAVASTLLFFELTRREWRGLLAAKTQAASMVADLFAGTVAAPVDFVESDPDALKSEIAHLETNPDVLCTAVWAMPAGRKIGELDRGGCAGLPIPADADIDQVRVMADRLEVSRLVRSPGSGRTIGRLRVVFSLAYENNAYAASRIRIFGLSFLLAAVTTLLLIAVARRQIVTPLQQLTRAAGRIGRGEFGGGGEVRSNDEIGELARAFDRMRGQLADREHHLESARQELRDLFDHMRQAIVAFDRDGRVCGAASRQATRLFGGANLEGMPVRELLYGGAAAGDLDAQAFDEWVAMAFDVPLEEWADFGQLAPHEVTLQRTAGPVPLELELRPVVKDGRVERVMLLATDVSEKKKLQLAGSSPAAARCSSSSWRRRASGSRGASTSSARTRACSAPARSTSCSGTCTRSRARRARSTFASWRARRPSWRKSSMSCVLWPGARVSRPPGRCTARWCRACNGRWRASRRARRCSSRRRRSGRPRSSS